MNDAILIPFLFALGACVGSFLNVTAGRFPSHEVHGRFPWLRAITYPPSHCPKCEHRLAWYDNIPVLGWFLLRGRCRYCAKPISIQYPIVEALVGGLFVFYYVMFFVLHVGPSAPVAFPPTVDFFTGRVLARDRMPTDLAHDWPIYALYMFMIAGLVVITLIDAERFEIPISLPWLMAGVGVAAQILIADPTVPGALNLIERGRLTTGAALAAGGGIGLMLSLFMRARGWLKPSFADGEPFLEIDLEVHAAEVEQAKLEGRAPPPMPRVYTQSEIRHEIAREMLFLMPPLLLAGAFFLLTDRVPAVAQAWQSAARQDWFSGALGAVLGALVGGLVVWLARIFGTLLFGRVAMGLGDVHLMFGVGAIIGAGAATLAFFLAPFAGLAYGLYRVFTRGKWELPFGPFLSMGAAAAILVWSPVARYLEPGLLGLRQLLAGG